MSKALDEFNDFTEVMRYWEPLLNVGEPCYDIFYAAFVMQKIETDCVKINYNPVNIIPYVRKLLTNPIEIYFDVDFKHEEAITLVDTNSHKITEQDKIEALLCVFNNFKNVSAIDLGLIEEINKNTYVINIKERINE